MASSGWQGFNRRQPAPPAASASPCFLGLDLGTSSLKAVLIDGAGQVLAVAAEDYGMDTPRPGWAEQDPEQWVRAAFTSTRQVLGQAGVMPRRVAGIGLSGQMHGTVCLGRDGLPLRPAILWADQRSGAQVDQVYETVGRAQYAAWIRNPLAAGFQLATWLWLRQHEPAIAHATAHLLLPKDYLRYRLTGVVGTESSDACATGQFDPAGGQWSEPLLAALGLDPRLLPALAASQDIVGGLAPADAAEMGLRPGLPVVYGGGDQPCQAVGNGVIEPGQVSCTIGTGGQLLAPLLTPTLDPDLRLHLYCHALSGRWYSMGAILAAGLALRWLRDSLFPGESYQTLADRGAAVPAGAEGLLFLPYLAGERTPHMDAGATGVFYGLTLRHTRDHVTRAVMEGVVFALRQALDLMVACGAQASRILASGGGARHPLWLQLQADILGRPIYRSRMVEAAATGAAMLAGVGAGHWSDVRSACSQVVVWADEVIEPNVDTAQRYDEAFARFCQLYPALRPVFASREA